MEIIVCESILYSLFESDSTKNNECIVEISEWTYDKYQRNMEKDEKIIS